VQRGRKTWLERRAEEEAALGYTEQPYVVIVGGGQGGIGLGARLRRLGVPTIIIERNEQPGDSWRKRYKSLCLHDPVWYDHMPYLPFPDDWPVFAPKDKVGDWLEMYTKVMELDYWGSTTARIMWKPTQVPHLWFHGGNLHQSRHYSQFLSLQLKARMEGLDTPVYELAPSHHRR
jgi:cation diffusion facilitator CzcD-associated flavoprotein CzcO